MVIKYSLGVVAVGDCNEDGGNCDGGSGMVPMMVVVIMIW